MLTPIGPSIPEAFHAVLTSIHDAIRELETPGAPKPAYACVQAGCRRRRATPAASRWSPT